MNLNNYRSFGRFTPVYEEAIQRIYDCYPPDRAKQIEAVLRAYASHADNIGTCYPSMRRIMERTHYSETTYKRAMVALEELDYIRVHEEYSIARRKKLKTYQVSPFVMWIVKDYVSEAISLWEHTSLHRNVTINAQPTPEPESEPTPEPDSGTRIRTTTTTRTDLQMWGDEDGDALNQNQTEGRKNQRDSAGAEKQTEGQTRQKRSFKSENQKSVPPPPPIHECKDPLISREDEDLALDLVTKFNTRIVQARQLVKQFGAPAVRAGVEWWKLENAKKPAGFGLLHWWLAENIVTPDDQPKKDSMFGQYEDYFTGGDDDETAA